MRVSRWALLGAAVVGALGTAAVQASNATWSGGSGGSSAIWLTNASWTGNAMPGANDVAVFGTAGSAGTSSKPITIDMGASGTNNGSGNQAVGEISITGARDRYITNSSTTTAGTLTLNGVSGTLLSDSASGTTMVITNGSGSAKAMNVVFANSGDIAVPNSTAIISIVSNAGGAVDIAKTGNGLLRLSGTNTFGGLNHTFTIKGGMVDASSDAALGSADTVWVIDGGTFQSSQTTSITYTRAWRLDSGGGTFALPVAANGMVLTGNISGAGGLTKTGLGQLTLSGATADYAGASNFNGGYVCLNTTLRGAGAVAIAASTPTVFVGSGTVTGATTVYPGGVVQPGPTFAVPGTGALTFTNGLTFNTSTQYAWNLGAPNTSNPGVDFSVINAGTGLAIASGAQLTLSFNGTAPSPDSGPNPFWTLPHDWTVATSAATTGLFTIGTTINTGAFTLRNTGTDVILHYAPPYTGPRTLAWAGTVGGDKSDACGPWDAATINWVNTADSSHAIWNSANPDVAVFGAGCGTGGAAAVSLGGAVTAGQICFAANSACYTLSGGSLTIAGVAGGGVAAHGSATVNSDIIVAGAQAWCVDTGATLTVAGSVSGTETLTKSGPGKLVLGGNNTHSGGTLVTEGTLVVDNANALGAGGLTVQNSAGVRLSAGGSKVLALPALAMDNTASMDLADNDLLIHHGDAGRVQALIGQAYRDPNYNVPGATAAGITTSSHTTLTTLGTLSGSAYIGFHGSASFGTYAGTVVPDDILVKYTYFGDVDLDGLVTRRDLALMDAGYLAGMDGVAKAATWADGDVNHDGIVDYNDFALADAASGQTTALGQQMFALHSAAFGMPYVVAYDAAVPEPGTLLLMAFGGACLRRRRRA